MSFTGQYPQGQLLSAPITNGSETAKFGTHIDFLGTGGYRTVATIADRDAIPTKNKLEFDGYGSGQRRVMMLVAVQETATIYLLQIAGYEQLGDAPRLAQLADNTNWTPLSELLGHGGGGSGFVDYAASVTYQAGDLVRYSNQLWRCVAAVSNTPPDQEYYYNEETGEEYLAWEIYIGLRARLYAAAANSPFATGDNTFIARNELREAQNNFYHRVPVVAVEGGVAIQPYTPAQGETWFGFGKIAKYVGNNGVTLSAFIPEAATGEWELITLAAQAITTYPLVVAPGQLYYTGNALYQFVKPAAYNLTFANFTDPEFWSVVVDGNAARQPITVNSTIKTAVAGGTFASGELQGAQPVGSMSGMRFYDANYLYQYDLAAADTDGTLYVWIRLVKA